MYLLITLHEDDDTQVSAEEVSSDYLPLLVYKAKEKVGEMVDKYQEEKENGKKYIPTDKALAEIILRKIVRLQPRYFEGFREYWNPFVKKEDSKPWPVVKGPKEWKKN